MMRPEAQIERKVQWISLDYNSLKELYRECIKFYSEQIQPLFASAKLLEILDLSNHFDQYLEDLKSLEPLQDLSEESLFHQYYPALKIAATKPFQDFTKECTEAFYRLKL